MKRLKTDINGGFPFVLDDLRWMQSGVEEAFKGLGTVVLAGQPMRVLSGIASTVNPSTFEVSITSGYVFMDGEVFFVPAQTVPFVGQKYWFDVVTTFDPAGDKIFQSGGPAKQTYEIRQLQLFSGTSLPAGKHEWISASFINRYTTLIGVSAPTPSSAEPIAPSWVISVDGVVSFVGLRIFDDTSGPGFAFGTLPAGSRPAFDVVFLYKDLNTYSDIIMVVGTDGVIRKADSSGSGPDSGLFDYSKIPSFVATW